MATFKRCNVGMEIQSVLFPKEHFTSSKAKSWAKAHGYSTSKLDETDNFYRFRQHSPSKFKRDSFRIINLANAGVKAIVACPVHKINKYKKSRDRSDVHEAIREFRRIPKSGQGKRRAERLKKAIGK